MDKEKWFKETLLSPLHRFFIGKITQEGLPRHLIPSPLVAFYEPQDYSDSIVAAPTTGIILNI